MKAITIITIILFGILAILAFALSYTSLQVTALHNGKAGRASYIWPLLIDGGLIIFSLAVVYKSLRNEKAYVQWLAVLLFTIATVLSNVFQETHPYTTMFVLGSAPVVLFATFETLMSMLRSGVERQDQLQNLEILNEDRQRLEQEAQQLKAKIKRLQRKEEKLDTPNSVQLTGRQKRIVEIVQSGQTNKSEIARQLDIARTTLYNDLGELTEQGVLSDNGQGLAIVM